MSNSSSSNSLNLVAQSGQTLGRASARFRRNTLSHSSSNNESLLKLRSSRSMVLISGHQDHVSLQSMEAKRTSLTGPQGDTVVRHLEGKQVEGELKLDFCVI